MQKPIKNILFFYSVFIGIIYVPLVSYLTFKEQNQPLLSILQFFTSDTFYYLSIARHSAGGEFFTSDGIYPTNGFHPLWGVILTKLFEIPKIYSSTVLQVYLVFGLSAILIVSGMLFFGFALYKITNNFLLSLLASIPGFYYLLFFSAAPNYNSTWSFINGMESPLSIFFFGLLSYLLLYRKILLHPNLFVSISLTILVTLIIFSRLDDVFFLIPYLLLLTFLSNSKKQFFLNFLISVSIPTVAIITYMLYNQSYADTFLPVSGLIKQGNWLIVNLVFFFTTFIPVGLINPTVSWSEASMRTLQMFIPVLFALFWILYNTIPFIIKKEEPDNFFNYQINPKYSFWLYKLWEWFRQPDNVVKEIWIRDHYQKIIITAFAFYVILKGLYNIIFVYIMGQGHWYYPISIMIFNLIFAVILSEYLKKYSVSQNSLALGISFIFIVVIIANSFIHTKLNSDYNFAYYNFWKNSHEINEQLLAFDKNIKIIEYDDGVMSYFMDIPVMNGFGFTLDQEAVEAQSNGRLLELGYKRGYKVIGLMSYINFQPNIMNSSDGIRDALRNMPGIKLENLDLWDFEFLYKNPNSSAIFIRFKPVQ